MDVAMLNHRSVHLALCNELNCLDMEEHRQYIRSLMCAT